MLDRSRIGAYDPDMSKLDIDIRARMLAGLVEGLGVRATARAHGVSVNAVQRLIRAVGPACQTLHDQRVRNLPCRKIQADEVWCFVGARQKRVRPERAAEWGDTWIWAALCEDTKIVPSWTVGPRNAVTARRLLTDLHARMEGRIQLTTDGLQAYRAAIGAFYDYDKNPDDVGVDYARVIKQFATPNSRWNDKHNRYEQPEVTGVTRERICGNPDVKNASTSYAERLNLGLRMHNRKVARLTNAHAKAREMLVHSLALTYTHYNWIKPHQALGGRTPAMACGLTDRRWTLADFVRLADVWSGNRAAA